MTQRILFLAANPTITDHLRLSEEVREIDIGIRRAKQRDNFILDQRHALRTEDFRRAMLDLEPEFVHFSGHGSGEDGIVLQNDFGEPHLISTESLASLFSLFPLTKCVLLNACYSQIQATAIREYVPYVIGMPSEIDDEIALAFSVSFYEAIGTGKSIEFAYQFSCNAMQMRGVSKELMPRLLHNEQLISKVEQSNEPKAEFASSEAHLLTSHFGQDSKLQMAQGCYIAWGKLTVSVTLAIFAIVVLSLSFFMDISSVNVFETLRKIAVSGVKQEPEYLPSPLPTSIPTATFTPKLSVPTVTDRVLKREPTIVTDRNDGTKVAQSTPVVTVSPVALPISSLITSTPSQLLVPTATPDFINAAIQPSATLVVDSPKFITIAPSVALSLLYVPEGEFFMGSTATQSDEAVALCNQYFGSGSDCKQDWFSDEEPQHKVRINAFWIMETEVTNDQFRVFVNDDGYEVSQWWTDAGWQWRKSNNITQPQHWENSQWSQSDFPVVGISWYEANAYAAWLSYTTGLSFRLPTEAEWEKAARGIDGLIFPWGNNWNETFINHCDQNCISDWNTFTDDGYQNTAPVGSYIAGASPYGVLDMAGNVWEWTSSQDRIYPYDKEDGREILQGMIARIVRGGAFDSGPDNYRTANRNRSEPDFRNVNLGMRLVLNPDG